MKKVECVALFNYKYDLICGYCYNVRKVIIMHHNNTIELRLCKTEYDSKRNMLKAILQLLKNNSYYVAKNNAFESTFYNVNFVDIENLSIHKFSLK